jgi:hypothetical protein
VANSETTIKTAEASQDAVDTGAFMTTLMRKVATVLGENLSKNELVSFAECLDMGVDLLLDAVNVEVAKVAPGVFQDAPREFSTEEFVEDDDDSDVESK